MGLEVAELPDVKDKLVGLGFDTATTPSEPFGRDLADEIKQWSDVVQQAKLRIQP
jgi:hypothetical protein